MPPTPRFFSSLTWPPIRSIPTEDDELFENIPPEQYDLNTVIPVPQKTLETHLVRIEPMVPSLHGDALHRAFSTPGADPLFYPAGKPYTEKRQTLIYLEIQRRRTNFLLFAIIDKHSEQLAGQIA
ncbi:hypothetical protein FRC02_007570 [Tulasnella sp. 418]|nr:hypothetical protein FRC02_007570 [Tulasnella sp. 418]